MSERKRNKFVVSKALINFVFAAVFFIFLKVVTKVMKVICH